MRQLRLFGALRIARDDRGLPLSGSRMRALIAYLALFPKANCSRERLVDLLWPDAPPGRGRHLLSNLLYQIRQTLGPDWIMVEGEQLRLNLDDLWLDTVEFDRLIRRADPTAWTEAIALYEDDLLSDLYDDWLTVPRLERREAYLTALAALVGMHQERNEPRAALHYARRLALAEPLREENQQTYLRLLARLDRRNEALAHYAALRQLLQQELGIPPLPETQAIAAAIRREATESDYQPMVPQADDSSVSAACPEPAPEERPAVASPGDVPTIVATDTPPPQERFERITVALAHRDVPLGRPLRDDDCILVTWTLHTPEDDRIHDKSTRRQIVLRRLLAEAAAQDAAPTDDDLAQALGVSRRTVLRDMEVLARQGVVLPTRKRKEIKH